MGQCLWDSVDDDSVGGKCGWGSVGRWGSVGGQCGWGSFGRWRSVGGSVLVGG